MFWFRAGDCEEHMAIPVSKNDGWVNIATSFMPGDDIIANGALLPFWPVLVFLKWR